MSVEVQELGEDPVSFGERAVPALVYSLKSESIKMKLWYGYDKDWLALESLLSNGSTLRYERTNGPAVTSPGGITLTVGD